MRSLTPILVVSTLVLSTAPVHALAIDEVRKILPDDNGVFDFFGTAVAISGNLALIGSPGDDDNGSASGSAYIYDITTGAQIRKLHALDGFDGDQFGNAVAISGPVGSEIAIVGAWQNDDDGSGSGSAYIFDANTGVQLFKLVASDAALSDQFGISVGISGSLGQGVAIVGANRNQDNGTSTGSAYLFDIATGLETFKLLPVDSAAGDQFGFAVAISGLSGQELAIVGAHLNDDNGAASGSAYLYDANSGSELVKLLPADGASGDQFGFSVGIGGPPGQEVAIVGALFDADNGTFSGSAYLFDGHTGLELGKLLPTDGEGFDEFGNAVAFDGITGVVGSHKDDDNGTLSGGAYLFSSDSDGDGLMDDWEINGIPYVDGAGVVQRFMLPGADPMRKNLYVEVDAMTGFPLIAQAATMVEAAFEAAPVSNPGGVDGIVLHILSDQTDLPHVEDWQIDGCWPVDFDVWKSSHYGTPSEQGNAGLLGAKMKAYRYCIIADSSAPGRFGGCGQIPGDNFVLYARSLTIAVHQAAAFMHELGHDLGLRHGGGDNINGKPNYPSIMNYLLSYQEAWNESFWTLDFSREGAIDFIDLNETMLDETLGIGTPAGFYRNTFMPFGVTVPDPAPPFTARVVAFARLNGSPTDFGSPDFSDAQDGSFDTDVNQDLNYTVDSPLGINLPSSPSFPDTLIPHDDWANVGLPLVSLLGEAAAAPEFPTDETTIEARDWIDLNFPMPPMLCVADTDGSGDVGIDDFLAVLAKWGPCVASCPEDTDASGFVGIDDFLAVLANWGACP